MEHVRRTPRVLLGDRDADTESKVRDCCARKGWTLHTVADSKELLRAASQLQYDVVVTDCSLTEGGEQLFHTLRRQSPGSSVLLLRRPDENVHELSEQNEIDPSVLTKPIDLDQFEDIVTNAAQQRSAFPAVIRHLTEYDFSSREFALRPFSLGILQELFDAGVLSHESFLRLTLAVQEALTNSLEHGNLELESGWKEEVEQDGSDRYSLQRKERLADPNYSERRISILAEYTPGKLVISIGDEGNGFLDGTSGEHSDSTNALPKVYGRGVSLITNAMDEVEYGRNGAQITMTKFLKE